MPLALMPQRLPAEYPKPQHVAVDTLPKTKRGFPTVLKALLISACLTVFVVLSLGAFKSSRHAEQATLATPPVPLAASTATTGTDGKQMEKNTVSSKTATSAKRTAHAGLKSGSIASKSTSSTPRAEKKLSHARTERATRLLADNAKKRPDANVAKAPKKVLENQPPPLLAQNSIMPANKATGVQDRFAQCQEAGNFLRREQCKWQVCSGKWGQDGCPSYASDNREIN